MANDKKDNDNPTPAEYENAAEFMIQMMEVQGVSVMQVKQGHLMMFKRSKLLEMLRNNPDAPVIQILIQHPTPKSGN